MNGGEGCFSFRGVYSREGGTLSQGVYSLCRREGEKQGDDEDDDDGGGSDKN